MTSSKETLKKIIEGYNPEKQDMLCKIDVIRLSQMPVLKNPTKEYSDVYETFFEYASALKKNHPTWDSESYIKERFGESFDKMAEFAPEASAKYEAIGKTSQSKGQAIGRASVQYGA